MSEFNWPRYVELGTHVMDRTGKYTIQVCRCGWQIEYDTDDTFLDEVSLFLVDHLNECALGREEWAWRNPDKVHEVGGLVEDWLGVVEPKRRWVWPWKRHAPYNGPCGHYRHRTRFLFVDAK